MKLSDINLLVQDFNIDPNEMAFYGEHDVVYVDSDSLPKEEDFQEWSDEDREAFHEKYSLHLIEGYWGFYT